MIWGNNFSLRLKVENFEGKYTQKVRSLSKKTRKILKIRLKTMIFVVFK